MGVKWTALQLGEYFIGWLDWIIRAAQIDKPVRFLRSGIEETDRLDRGFDAAKIGPLGGQFVTKLGFLPKS